jgi:hypothetical protein
MVPGGIGMKSIVWDHQESRQRAGWRLLLIVVAAGLASTTLTGPGRRLLTERLPYLPECQSKDSQPRTASTHPPALLRAAGAVQSRAGENVRHEER